MEIGELGRRLYSIFSRRPYNFNWVNELIAASGRPKSRRQLEWLREQGISAILSLTESPLPQEMMKGLGMEYAHVPMRNHERPTLEQLQLALNVIERVTSERRKILVHCAGGKGRTGTVIAAYLVYKEGMTPERAIELVRSIRPGSIERSQEASIFELFEWAVARKG